MKIDKSKSQKKIERFMRKPAYHLFLGLTVTKDTDIEDEEIVEEENFKKTIKQKIHGTIFTTEIKLVNELNMPIKESSKMTVELKEGTRLIWIKGQGYILPQEEVKTVKEVEEDLSCLNDIEGV